MNVPYADGLAISVIVDCQAQVLLIDGPIVHGVKSPFDPQDKRRFDPQDSSPISGGYWDCGEEKRGNSMKKLICLLFVVAWFSSPPMGEAAEESESHHEKNILVDLSKIPRNQPIIKRIFEWNHRIVVETEDLYYRLDLEKQTATPIFLPRRSVPDRSFRPKRRQYLRVM